MLTEFSESKTDMGILIIMGQLFKEYHDGVLEAELILDNWVMGDNMVFKGVSSADMSLNLALATSCDLGQII